MGIVIGRGLLYFSKQ
uniref:Uncharacterized protein n=1 Tax=Anguilla anguilla TaxID=7936 RepID=A0A0E9W4D3_ANGAN